MKILLNIFALLFANFCFSQISIDQINDALKTHKVSKLRKVYRDDLDRKYWTTAWTNYDREVIEGYRESLIDVQIPYRIPGDSTLTPYESEYRIKLISKGNMIIAYELAKREFHYRIIDSFKNQETFNQFKVAFKKKYETDLVEDDLCNDRVVGMMCGLGAFKPLADYSTMEFFVKNQKTDSLLTWLRSANTEKQIFGFLGFLQLKKNGYAFTDYEQRFIDIAKNRKGFVMTCGGCDQFLQPIQEYMKKFTIK